MPHPVLPPIPDDFEPTRATLHAYAHGVGAIPRAHGAAHDKWWHISLKVRPDGLTTDPVPLPDGGELRVRMDLQQHDAVLETSDGRRQTFGMTEGLTGTQFADQLIDAVADLGLQGSYQREKFESDEARTYDPDVAGRFLNILIAVDQLFQHHRASLAGEVGPVQLWPHGFDLAFEWFGTRVVEYDEGGETAEFPSQLNLGFYPAGRAYFYSNPWPFEADQLLGTPLPSGAEWHTEGWEGTILYYDQLAGDPESGEELLAYARAVHELAAPTLTV